MKQHLAGSGGFTPSVARACGDPVEPDPFWLKPDQELVFLFLNWCLLLEAFPDERLLPILGTELIGRVTLVSVVPRVLDRQHGGMA